jgi:hypothetical protein
MVLVGDACIRNGRRSLALEQPGLRGAIEVGGEERVVSVGGESVVVTNFLRGGRGKDKRF